MRFLACVFLAGVFLVGALPAQQSQLPKTLPALQQQFAQQLQSLGRDATGEQRRELLQRQQRDLRAFVGQAAGDDRWNGRLMLADLSLMLGDRGAAQQALGGLDPAAAPALALLTGAAMAQQFQDSDLRGRLLAAALARPAELQERLAMGRLLAAPLHEVQHSEQMFAMALAAAKDDETRAMVRFHAADALRDREDLPHNEAWDALARLAKDLPSTYWGSVAKDRLQATQFAVGQPAPAFAVRTVDGEALDSAKLGGKAIALWFFSHNDADAATALDLLQQARKQYGDSLFVLAVALDPDVAGARALAANLPLCADGKGMQGDLPLRWFVEAPAIHVIGRDGRFVALNQHIGTGDAREDLQQALGRAVKD